MNALDLLASLVLEDGRRWGDAAASFQWADATAVLDPTGLPFHFLTRARGGSKTADLAGIAVASMLTDAPIGARLYAVAADRDQGRLLLDSIDGFLRRTPTLRGALQVGSYRVAAPRTGVVLEVLAADAPGAWGLRPWMVIVDELAAWPSTSGARGVWEAVTTSTAKVDGARLIVLTTAGDPAHWSRGVRDHASADPLWRVHEVPGPPPWADLARLAEQRRRLPESSYRRLFENEWTSTDDRLVDDDDLAACVVLDGIVPPQAGRRYAIGVDVGLKRDATAVAVCHAENVTKTIDNLGGEAIVGTRVVLDRLGTWQGSRDAPVSLGEVEEWIVEAATRYAPAEVIFDPWQSVGTQQRLAGRGLRVHEYVFSAQSVGRLASTLFRLLRDRSLALPADEALIDELRNVRLRETSPGVLRMDHDAGKNDDRAVSLALAAHRLVERPVVGDLHAEYQWEPDTGRDPLGSWHVHDGIM